MRILIDSHILYWSIVEPEKVKPSLAKDLMDGDNQVWASAVGIAELRIKQCIGKLKLPDDFDGLIENTGFETLPFRASHAHWLAELPLHHRDPFDRMLIAQALSEGLTIATADAMFSRYPVSILKN
jgi:PIN domain nuclease of toxin-antitoxin system